VRIGRVLVRVVRVHDRREAAERQADAGTGHGLAIRSADTPLEIQVTTDATSLWPANHAMLPVTITADVLEGFTAPDNLLVCPAANPTTQRETEGMSPM
jgi:hypothetical protein